jgi:hypothetical protein
MHDVVLREIARNDRGPIAKVDLAYILWHSLEGIIPTRSLNGGHNLGRDGNKSFRVWSENWIGLFAVSYR